MAITRLSGGITPADGADPRTFPAIWNAAADEIETSQNTQGSAISALDAKNIPTFGTATPANGNFLAYATATAAWEPNDGTTYGGTPIYRFVDTLYYTSAGTATFTKATYPWLRKVFVKVVGGGGGSAGVSSAAGRAAGGGGGGGYAEKAILVADLGSSENVVVGAGGTAGAAGDNAGGTGGTSSFGTHCSATGGAAGAVAVVTNTLAAAGGEGGAGGNGSGGDLNLRGDDGGTTIQGPTGVVAAFGGGTFFASLKQGTRTTTGLAGETGRNYGGGATGAINLTAGGTRAGGVGAPGIVLLELYA
jgi:hypothetical protein